MLDAIPPVMAEFLNISNSAIAVACGKAASRHIEHAPVQAADAAPASSAQIVRVVQRRVVFWEPQMTRTVSDAGS